jgi:hypothetical protein
VERIGSKKTSLIQANITKQFCIEEVRGLFDAIWHDLEEWREVAEKTRIVSRQRYRKWL